MIKTILAGLFFALGLFLFFSEILGLFKFKYVMNRMHAAALGDTFGILFVILGCIVLKGVSLVSLKLLVVPLFMFLTGPVVTHLIGQTEVLYHGNPKREYKKEDRT